MAQGTYFKIRSKLNRMVLDVAGSRMKMGEKVITYPEKAKNGDNQVWFFDPATNTIRPKLDPSYCMDLDAKNLVVINPYNGGNNQQWILVGDHIQKLGDPNKILDIYGNDPKQGARIFQYKPVGNLNQKWGFESVGGIPPSISAPKPQPTLQTSSPHATPKNGYFKIRSKLNRMVLDVAGSRMKKGEKVITYPEKAKNGDNQVWFFDPATSTIRPKLDPSYCMDLDAKNLVVINPYNGGNNQQWILVGDHIQKLGDPNKILDIYGNDPKQGARIFQYKPVGNLNQKWGYESVGGTPPSVSPSTPQPTIQAPSLQNGYFKIRSKLNRMVLDVAGGRIKKGEKVITYPEKANNGDNQVWFLDPATNTIRPKLDPSYCMDLDAKNLVVINPYNGGNNQQWILVGDHIQKLGDPNKILDIYGNDPKQGARIFQYKPVGNLNQKWGFESVRGTPPIVSAPEPQPNVKASSPHATPLTGYFKIRSKLNRMVLDVAGSRMKKGEKVITYPEKAKNGDNQVWFFDPATNTIRPKLDTSFCMDLDAKGLLVINPYNDGDNQKWILVGDLIMKFGDPNKVLDILGNNRNKGARIIQYPPVGQANEQWIFEYIDDSPRETTRPRTSKRRTKERKIEDDYGEDDEEDDDDQTSANERPDYQEMQQQLDMGQFEMEQSGIEQSGMEHPHFVRPDDRKPKHVIHKQETNSVFTRYADYSFRDVFSHRRYLWIRDKYVDLPGDGCTRMGLVDGAIWLPIRDMDHIKVLNQHTGRLISKIELPERTQPWCVHQVTESTVVMAADSGLFALDLEGKVTKKIREGTFCDINGDGVRKFVCIDYIAKEALIFTTHSDDWKLERIINLTSPRSAEHRLFSSAMMRDDKVTASSNTHLTGSGLVRKYITQKKNRRRKARHHEESDDDEPGYDLRRPKICGIDRMGHILIADAWRDKLFVHDPSDESLAVISLHYQRNVKGPRDVLLLSEDCMWVLMVEAMGNLCLVKYIRTVHPDNSSPDESDTDDEDFPSDVINEDSATGSATEDDVAHNNAYYFQN